PKMRARAESFRDYFSQATLFWRSLSAPEQQHLIEAAQFELGKVETKAVRERMLGLFAHVDPDLARRVSAGIGVAVPADNPRPGNLPPSGRPTVERSPALSMANTVKDTIASRRVAILAGSGLNLAEIQAIRSALESAGAKPEIVAPVLGPIAGAGGNRIEADKAISTVSSVMYDAVFVPSGPPSEAALAKQEEMRRFIAEAYRHGKTIGATGAGIEWLSQAGVSDGKAEAGVVTTRETGDLGAFSERFIAAIAQHRHWERLSPKH
ncbi:MAG: catalase-related domain-containing protein, partial [Chloroflexota bacterium]